MEQTYMTEIDIQKVRHLSDVHIPFFGDDSKPERKHLILTGKNGSGKTSVLHALMQQLEFIVSDDYAPLEECEKMVAQLEADRDSGNANKLQKLVASPVLAKWKTKLSRAREGITAEFTSIDALREKYANGDFILAYFADKRALNVTLPKSIENITTKPVYGIAESPNKDFERYLLSLKARQSFAQTDNEMQKVSDIAAWFERFESILRRIYDDDSLKLRFNSDTFRFSIEMANREPFDFNTMSMGYAAIFDIIADILMRMEAKREYNLEGIVLIDEVENHLHVELQKNIMPILTDLFPNVQFILTTHSPFILNSVPNSIVYDLEKHLLVENGLTNLPYDGIVESYFDTDTFSSELREKFERYKELVSQPECTDAEYAEMSELELYLDEVPDYLALDFAVEYNRLRLEADR